MTYSAAAGANAFIQRAREGKLHNLTSIKLQKLLFFAQVWSFKLKDEPLIDDSFCRWETGPVLPAMYHVFQHMAREPVDHDWTLVRPDANGRYQMQDGSRYTFYSPSIPDTDKPSWNLIDKIIEVYGELSVQELIDRLTNPSSVWAREEATGSPITYQDMRRYVHGEM